MPRGGRFDSLGRHALDDEKGEAERAASRNDVWPHRPYLNRALHAFEGVLEHVYAGDWPARLWARVPGACRIRTVAHEVRIGRPEEAPRLRVGFASDLHVGPLTPQGLLDAAAQALAKARPDLLVLGGDFVYLRATPQRLHTLARWVAAVPARTKVAVLGNHDHFADERLITAALEDGGAEVLTNRALRLPPPHDDVTIVGLDDPLMGRPDPDRALAGVDGAPSRIVACHSTDILPELAGRGLPLLLSGHTHGGQVALPNGRPLLVPGRFGRQLPWGRHSALGTEVVVSRGVGAVGLPIRLFAHPEVVILTVR